MAFSKNIGEQENMNTLSMHVLHSVQGGKTTAVLAPEETFTVYFASAIGSNLFMSFMGVSPLHSFPISLFTSLIPVYVYCEAKKNPA